MKKFLVFLLLGVLVVPTLAHADEAAKRELAAKLLELHHAKEIAQSSADQLNQMLLVQLGAADYANSDRAGFDALRQKTAKLLDQEFDWKQIEKEYVDLYVKTFSEDELRQIVAFSSSPAGQKLQQVNAQLVESSREIGKRHTAAVVPEIQKLVKAFVAEHKEGQKEETPAPSAAKPEQK